MALTDTAVRNAKPRPNPYKLSDGQGLSLVIRPNGGKWWRFRYYFGGKEKMLSLGVYPEVGLKDARERRDEARKLVASDMDPSEARKAEKVQVSEEGETFELIAHEWHEKFKPSWTTSHADKIMRRFKRDIFPWLGSRPIREITAPELLAVIRRIESRGIVETAHKALQNCGGVFRYAVATGRAERNPAADLGGALPPKNTKHHPSIVDPKGVAELLRAMEGYTGSFVTLCAMRLAPLVFVRPGELRKAEWAEVDLDKAEWRIPAAKMKMREQHIVPLSKQAVAILQELQPLTGSGLYVFPGERSAARPMSENTVNAALRRLGYTKEQMTGHGFRSLATTLLNEMGFNRDWIERQLAHGERNGVRAAYNFAEYLPERRKMMQAWGDYLDGLKSGAKVIPINREQGA